MSDTRFDDSRLKGENDNEPPAGSIWGWVAGFAVLALIAFIIIAGWNNGEQAQQRARSTAAVGLGTCASVPLGEKVHLDCGEKKYEYDKK